MARLRNFSSTLLRPFQSPSPDHQHTRSVSQPLALQTPDSPPTTSREKPLPSPTVRGSGFSTPARTPTRQGDYSSSSRPTSMLFATPGNAMGRADNVEELLPVFAFLSSHSNKLYQEGYFLKLNDLDTSGRPNADRNWTECFAQLVGTVLSLWDAAALDAAGQDGEVAPAFINLADASIKMIETLPTRNQDVQPLQNVLSISTAGKNRYLLHFNSLHSLTQWTAGIRLAMFEHSSLHELYTGSLIAGKGKYLPSIKAIIERSKFAYEDWARVRFGAGTPWRRCWCVVEPPNEKEFVKAQKSLKKARGAYERPRHPKGSIKFFDTKKTKKALPIATITDAYAAYAIYPQSKPLIDQSTLVKVEGRITIHSTPESNTEGFVFVMPEVHPAVSGFEIMLRWMFPVFDTFGLYGRPERLIADRNAVNGLMFAMPKEKRYGYLDIIDVAALIHTGGSDKWTERDWRKRMKEATRNRMDMVGGDRTSSTLGGRRAPSASFGSRNGVKYDDSASIRSHPSQRHQQNLSSDAVFAVPQRTSATPSGTHPLPAHNYHARSVSESVAFPSPTRTQRQEQGYGSSRMSMDRNGSDRVEAGTRQREQYPGDRPGELEALNSKNSSDSELGRVRTNPEDVNRDMRQQTPPGPVAAPPNFTHHPGDKPATMPNTRPDLRREKSRMSNATLSQMVDANRNAASGAAAAATGALIAWKSNDSSRGEQSRPVNQATADRSASANADASKGLVADYTEGPVTLSKSQSRSASAQSTSRKPVPRSSSAQSVNRKPLPNQAQAPPVPQYNESNLGLASDASLLNVPLMQRQASGNSQFSTSSYGEEAVGNPFSDAHRMEQPQTGVQRTAGDGDIRRGPSNGIPNVDFGATRSLTSNVSRPGASIQAPTGRKTLVKRAVSSEDTARSREQSHSPATWQPGSGRHNAAPAPTAEDFVQQRSAAAKVPNAYASYRGPSGGERQPPQPAHHAAQLAFNSAQQQQSASRQPPVQYMEDSNYNYGSQPPAYSSQAQQYGQQTSARQPQPYPDARQNGQWAGQQQQGHWGGMPPQQQYQQQQPSAPHSGQQGQRNQGLPPSQQWQQSYGYQASEQARRQ